MRLSPKKFVLGRILFLFALMGLFLAHGMLFADEKRPLMRFPDIHGDTIVFVHGEDIWTVPAQGGIATRLTIHDGQERFPKFSPDGSQIAFTGEYDGNADVYVMDIYGGNITRVTFHPGNDQVVGWYPQTNKIIFSSGRHSYSRFSKLFLIFPDGSGLEELILNEAAAGSFSPDGNKIAFNKLGRERRTWKRYTGGMAQDIYLYDFKSDEIKTLTKFEGTDRTPMWIGDKIYFSSDRKGVLNIFVYDTQSNTIGQITHHTEYDVRRPSEGMDRIVYELGGTLWTLDVKTGESRKIPIDIKADAAEARPYLKQVSGFITDYNISPKGKRALVVSRGEIFSVPKNDGPTRNLSSDCGARDKDVAWSPNGKKIAYLSDSSGEYEIHIVDPLSKNRTVPLTQHKNGYRHTLRWSPDSKKIAFADQTLRCYFLDVETKKITEVDKAHFENVDVSLDVKAIYDFNWSPDSRYLAYSKMDEDLVNKIYVYELDSGKIHCVSEGIFNDFNPVFSKDGEHLFFVSNRRFDPTYCDFEWELVYKNAAGIYCLTLKKEGQPLFAFKNDEEGVDKKPKKENSEKDKEKVNVRIDFAGITKRIEPLPLPAANYRNLAVNDTSLFYMNGDEGDYNRFEFRGPGSQILYSLSFKGRKASAVIADVSGYKLSADGKHIVYRKGRSVGIISSDAKDSKGHALDLSGMKMWLNPKTEWKQMFNEAWRMERDLYYEPDMHGVDWDAMKTKYERLLPYVSCRQDIQYLIGELIGELNTSHTYVYGGDVRRRASRVNVGMLGADWGIDPAAKRYKFKKIYDVPDWSRGIVPPLMRPGVHVKAGDYLLKINGRDVSTEKNIYSYFLDLAGRQVTLLVNSRPVAKGAREIVVKPVRSESQLRYLSWVEHNRKVCEEASNGQIGYIHLPDTYLGSSVEFPKYWYAQMRKKGLIIDGRFNGGGLDPDIFLRRLQKPVHAYWTRRYSHDQTIPEFATRAHMVCLTNRQAGSGGDMLPMEFRMRRMGPIVGTRTWGGLVGVSYFYSLIDGGGLSTPDYRIYDPSGKWIVENEGITPDFIVDLYPKEVADGIDAQLQKGIELLLDKIKSDPRPWPKHGPYKVDKSAKKR